MGDPGDRRRILVTGGCGSVGKAVVDYLVDQDEPPDVVVLDNDEQRLFEQRRTLGRPTEAVTYRLGDVREPDRLSEVFRQVDDIVHAAALKQVPQCERQPYESVKTNVEGTRNVVQLAGRHDVDSVLTVSTDKATNPSSVMGASKLLAERVTLEADQHTGPDGPAFSSVRLGNVVGSSGSVVPLFLQQIANGGPVTLTDDRMTRFVISKRDAAAFIADHIGEGQSGVTYIPELQALRIEDLAEVMTDIYRHRAPNPRDITVEETGRRPGERLHEILVSADERHRTAVRDDEYVVYPPAAETPSDIQVASEAVPENGLSSKYKSPMSNAEIRDLLLEADPVESATDATGGTPSIAGNDD